MRAFHTGDEIGGYRIVRRLGKGGMGSVYEVEHIRLGVHYALKTFTFEADYADVLKQKFLVEGKVLARLREAHLVRVFDLDYDEASGTPYFVMDLVLYKDGDPHTLADVDTSDIDEKYLVRWFEDLAQALDYIHFNGIVHRDIKLGNVLLGADKHVVLSDFGISRFTNRNLGKELDSVRTAVTGHSTQRLVMGTAGYMAPEVRRGREATAAADSYSLGVMFAYLLTGMWYERGSKVLQLLEGFDFGWGEILPLLLAENPAERAKDLVPLAHRLCESKKKDEDEVPKWLQDAWNGLRSIWKGIVR